MVYANQQNKTRKRLQEALITLLKKKKFVTITIADITKEAGYDRSSFYRYYDDKYALAEEIETALIAGIEQRYLQVLEKNTSDLSLKQQIATLLSVFRNPEVALTIQALTVNTGDISFEPRLRQLFERLFSELAPTDLKSSEEVSLIKHYLAGLFIQTIQLQTAPQSPLSSDQLAGILTDIYFSGFTTALHRNYHA